MSSVVTTAGAGRVREATTGRIDGFLTLATVLPVAAVAVLYALQVDVLVEPSRRRVVACAVVGAVPVLLFLLRMAEDISRPGGVPRWSAPAWFLVGWGLLAVPVIARVSLGTTDRPGGPPTRSLHLPQLDWSLAGILLGFVAMVVMLAVGMLCGRAGRWLTVPAAVVAVGLGLASVPVTLFALVLTYDTVASAGDHPLADAFQTMGLTWFVPAPMAGLLAGWSAVRSARGT